MLSGMITEIISKMITKLNSRLNSKRQPEKCRGWEILASEILPLLQQFAKNFGLVEFTITSSCFYRNSAIIRQAKLHWNDTESFIKIKAWLKLNLKLNQSQRQ